VRSYQFVILQGGYLVYAPDQLSMLKDAVLKFQEKDDRKAAAIFSLSYSSGTVRTRTWYI
jgi:hypothetical protein